MVELAFLGAAGTVTGAKFLLDTGSARLLVDCGLFQGLKEFRLRNWDRLPIDLASLDSILLTHAHIDHTGYLPRILRDGFRGEVHATPATAELCGLLLPDSGGLQEEEADYHNRKGTSKHKPAVPLYTEKDGRRAAERVRSIAYDTPLQATPDMAAVFRHAGHILGSSHLTVEITRSSWRRSVLVSGDLGPYDSPVLPDPSPVGAVDYLVLESTYGDRVREPESPNDRLEKIVRELAETRGVLVVPAFAVGRTQLLLYALSVLEAAGRIPQLPVYVDSPMAIDVTEIYSRYPDELDPELRAALKDGRHPLSTAQTQFLHSSAESRGINEVRGPAIIVSASGMATGGRVLHHLRRRLPEPENVVLLVGYQAAGTRGARLLRGEKTLRIFGEDVPVRARVESLQGFSAHADQTGLLRWLSTAERPPRRTFLVHGEPASLETLAAKIREKLGWEVHVPAHEQRVPLD